MAPAFLRKLTKLFKQTMDDSTSLIAVPSTYSLSQAFKLPSSSGNLWKFEKPSRLRFTRDFNLYRLHKRLLDLLQSSKDKYRIRKRYSMDEGSSSFAFPSKHTSFILAADEISTRSLFSFQQSFKCKLTIFFRHGMNEQFGVLVKTLLTTMIISWFNLPWCCSKKKEAMIMNN